MWLAIFLWAVGVAVALAVGFLAIVAMFARSFRGGGDAGDNPLVRLLFAPGFFLARNMEGGNAPVIFIGSWAVWTAVGMGVIVLANL
ncbi:MAG: hypothetical protein ACAI43_16660 [Phycisphaerae bacterium]|nr:hypothetical protein [Tepidisphaeraceae bacterium]